MAKKRQVPPQCVYWRMFQFYNHGGALKCMQCEQCIADYEAQQRVEKWNRDTKNGADPKR